MLFPLNIKFCNKVSKFKILFDDIIMIWFRKKAHMNKIYYKECLNTSPGKCINQHTLFPLRSITNEAEKLYQPESIQTEFSQHTLASFESHSQKV